MFDPFHTKTGKSPLTVILERRSQDRYPPGDGLKRLFPGVDLASLGPINIISSQKSRGDIGITFAGEIYVDRAKIAFHVEKIQSNEKSGKPVNEQDFMGAVVDNERVSAILWRSPWSLTQEEEELISDGASMNWRKCPQVQIGCTIARAEIRRILRHLFVPENTPEYKDTRDYMRQVLSRLAEDRRKLRKDTRVLELALRPIQGSAADRAGAADLIMADLSDREIHDVQQMYLDHSEALLKKK